MLVDEPEDLRAADLLGPERLHHHRHRVGDADRVGDLHLAAVGQAGGHDVLGHVAGRVGGRAVDLARVLAGERAAAVAGHAAVGVDDDLAAGEARVADGAADHEAAGRVDEEVLAQLPGVVELLRQDRLDDVLPEVVRDQRLGALLVLRGDQQLLDLDRPAVAVAHGHLRLAVGTQVRDHLGLADVGQAVGELVGERDRERHQLVGLVARVAEHHALVARPGDVELIVVGGVMASLVGLVDALRDVGRLLVDRVDDRARIGAEAEVGVGVADLADRLARDVLDVHVRGRRDLAGDHDEAGVHQRLAGHAAGRIVAQHGVQDAVGDLVGDLVGVALRDGLGGEQVLVVVHLVHGISRNSSAVESDSSRLTTAPAARTCRRSSRTAGKPGPRFSPVRSPSARSWRKSAKASASILPPA